MDIILILILFCRKQSNRRYETAQAVNHDFTYEKAMALFDDYIDDRHSAEELMLEIYTMVKESDYIKTLSQS